MPTLSSSHSSACCGARCITGFSYSTPTKEQISQLDAAIGSAKMRRTKGYIQCIITDIQATFWHKILIERGFIRTSRFYNSGNSTCNVYEYLTGQDNLIGKTNDPIKKLDKIEKERAAPVSSPFAKQAPETAPPRRSPRTVNASPRATRLATERGINLTTIRGTGPGGRILVRDLD